jgi:hypothetical protein
MINSPLRRESVLGIYGPLSLWGVGLVLSFGLLEWSVNMRSPHIPSTFVHDLYINSSETARRRRQQLSENENRSDLLIKHSLAPLAGTNRLPDHQGGRMEERISSLVEFNALVHEVESFDPVSRLIQSAGT